MNQDLVIALYQAGLYATIVGLLTGFVIAVVIILVRRL